MFSLTPTSTPADMHSVYALLNVLADPEAVKRRLDELRENAAVAADAAEKAAATQAAAKTALAEHDSKQQQLTARENYVTKREQALSAEAKRQGQLQIDLDARAQQIEHDRLVLETLQTQHAAEHAAMLQTIRQRINFLDAQEVAVTALKTELAGKLAKIKEIQDAS